jgi:hypothetical protein
MLYICCREADGYQQVSSDCAPATAVHRRIGRGRNQTRHSQRPTLTWTDTEARGVGQAVWVEPGSGPRSSPAARGRGTGGFVSSPGNSRCLAVARGHRGGLLYKDHAGNKGPSIGSSKHDGIRLFEGGNGAGSDRRRPKSSTLRRAKLGVSRNLVCARRDAAAIEYHQDSSSSCAAVSPGRFRGSRFQEGITGWSSPNPCCVPRAGCRRGGGGVAQAFVRIGEEHRFLRSRGDGRIYVCRFFAVTPNRDLCIKFLFHVGSGLVAPLSDSVVTSLSDELLRSSKSFGLLEWPSFLSVFEVSRSNRNCRLGLSQTLTAVALQYRCAFSF